MFRNEFFDSYEHFIKMIQEILPNGFISVLGNNCIYFHYIKQYDGLIVAPSLLASVFVDANLEIKLFISSKLMPNPFYSHLLLLSTLRNTSELRIFCLCKSVCHSSKDFISSNRCLSLVVNLLKFQRSSLIDYESLSLIRFVIKQLQHLKYRNRNVLLLLLLPDPFRGMEAWRKTIEHQKPGNSLRSGPEVV